MTDCYLPRLGGIELQVHDLALRQRAAGHDVDILTATPPAVGVADPPWVRRLVLDGRHPLTRSAAAAVAGRRLFRSAPAYDVVHVHLSVLSPLATAAAHSAAGAGLPTAVTLHSLWSGLGPVPRLADAAMGLRDWPVAWSAVSEVAAQSLRQAMGAGPQVLVLPNGIDPSAWSTSATPRDPRRVDIVSVMRLAPRKRPLHLLRMLRGVRARVTSDVDVRAVLIGEGPERSSLQRYLRSHDMADWVSLPGRLGRPAIRDVFAGSDVYVAPAELESFGIAALEARCAGLPVVAMARGGVGEFITHGREGLLAASDADMVDALVALTASPALRCAIAAHNRAVPPELNWSGALRQAAHLYDVAAARAATPGSACAAVPVRPSAAVSAAATSALGAAAGATGSGSGLPA